MSPEIFLHQTVKQQLRFIKRFLCNNFRFVDLRNKGSEYFLLSFLHFRYLQGRKLGFVYDWNNGCICHFR